MGSLELIDQLDLASWASLLLEQAVLAFDARLGENAQASRHREIEKMHRRPGSGLSSFSQQVRKMRLPARRGRLDHTHGTSLPSDLSQAVARHDH
jgi:hypothetical protein